MHLPLTQALGALATASELINGDFELGVDGWSASSSNGYKGVYAETDPDWIAAFQSSISAHSGIHAIWFASCQGVDEFAVVSQRIALPANARTLSYFSLPLSRESTSAGGQCNSPDRGTVLIDGVQVDALRLCEQLDGEGNPVNPGWSRRSIDITAYAGRIVTVRFAFESDIEFSSNWLVDDVTVSASP